MEVFFHVHCQSVDHGTLRRTFATAGRARPFETLRKTIEELSRPRASESYGSLSGADQRAIVVPTGMLRLYKCLHRIVLEKRSVGTKEQFKILTFRLG